jgi:hypothetical protein
MREKCVSWLTLLFSWIASACTKCILTEQEEQDILTCNESSRPTLISFMGQLSRSQTRRDLYTLRNESGVLVGKHGELFPSEILNTTDRKLAFEILAKRSAFSAASRGTWNWILEHVISHDA